MLIKHIITLTFLSFLLTVFISFSVSAADYYVSPDGVAEWPNCTKENTCHPHTALENAQAGDTVYFLDGTYTVKKNHDYTNYRYPSWQPANSGKESDPIVFKALNNKQAHLRNVISNDNVGAHMIGTYKADAIIWDGFTIKVEDKDGNPKIAKNPFYNTDYSGIKNCEIQAGPHDTGGSVNWEGIRVENANFFIAENCVVHGFIETSGNHNTSGFKSYDTDNLTIKNCEFSNNTGGIYIKGYPHKNVKIKNNYLHDNGVDLYFTVGTSLSRTEEGESPANENISILNNVILGLIWIDHNSGGLMNDTIVKNNTFINGRLEWCSADEGRGPEIFNNIFYSTISRRDYVSRGSNEHPIAADHNRLQFNKPIRLRKYENDETYYSTLAEWHYSSELYDGGNPGTGSITGDPQFVNKSKNMDQLNDFKLAKGSPCKGAGRDGKDMGADISTVGVQNRYELQPPSALKID